jgi:hypothetical protein
MATAGFARSCTGQTLPVAALEHGRYGQAEVALWPYYEGAALP